jgi:hypothetical protein
MSPTTKKTVFDGSIEISSCAKESVSTLSWGLSEEV